MFIITKTFTDDEGHLFTKVNPKQYSTPEEAYDAMREDYLNELKSRGLEDNGSSNDDGESCPGGYIIILQEMNGGVVIYHEASKEDPENLPAGWYIDDKDYTTFSIANDPEAVKCLKAPLKNGGYSFEERKAFWDSFLDFKAPKLRLPVKIAKRSGCKL